MTTLPTGRDVVRRALASPATLAGGRLVCIDGPAGSGKTTLAATVQDVAPAGMSCRVLHMDDLYPGWAGLAEGVAAMATGVVAPLGRGLTGRYQRYDWVRQRLAEHVDVQPVDLLVVEGVGSGATAYAASITTLVWVESEEATRLARGLARDGETARDHWLEWMRQEQRWFTRERTRERADLVIVTDEQGSPPVKGTAHPPR